MLSVVSKTLSEYIASGKCLLCDEISLNNPLSHALGIYSEASEMVICESGDFIVIRDISPIIDGHLLIATKQHMGSVSQIPESSWNELADIKDQLRMRLSSNLFFFEHGCPTGAYETSSCISHAHIHVIPVDIPIADHLQKYSKSPVRLEKLDMRVSLSRAPSDYLYYENSSGYGCMIRDIVTPLPHQLIRMIVADICNIDDWCWQESVKYRSVA